MRLLLVWLAIGAALTASAASACRDPLSETRTFFSELPKPLAKKPVVAKVKVLSSKVEGTKRITEARVVLAISGPPVSTTLKISSDTSSCNHDPALTAGAEFFVAGTVGTDRIFRGTWTQREIAETP